MNYALKTSHLLTFIFVCFLSTISQGQTFSAQAEFGGNFSQVDGDYDVGFNKLGINGGLTVSINPKERWAYSLGLFYSQKGSRSSNNSLQPFKLNLNYVDFPLMVSYLDYDAGDYYHIKWQAGLVIGQLISASSDIPGSEALIDAFNKTDIAYRIGATLFFTKHIGFSIHYQRSFNRLFKSSDHPTIWENDLQYHLFQTQIIYAF